VTAPPLLEGWDNFYVIAGSAAAGLTGLTFVVIALVADAHRVNVSGLRAFVTPTIVHFGSVLALAAFLTVPRVGPASLAVGFAAGGIAGVCYALMIARNMRGHGIDYLPVREDWLWHVMLPASAYAALLAMALLVGGWPEQTLYGVAAIAMLLLFIGIHNAWDIAVWISLHRKDEAR